MEVLKREIKELFIPTARCFKGMAILFFIWGAASLLICALVPTIIFNSLEMYPPTPAIQNDNQKLNNE